MSAQYREEKYYIFREGTQKANPLRLEEMRSQFILYVPLVDGWHLSRHKLSICMQAVIYSNKEGSLCHQKQLAPLAA